MNPISQITALATPVMTAFQSDLDHDRAWIEAHPGIPFIHITRRSGTHIFPLPAPDALRDDKPVPHLFGEARPSEVYAQVRALIAGQLKESGRLWLQFDGKRLAKRKPSACLADYDRALAIARRAGKKATSCGALR